MLRISNYIYLVITDKINSVPAGFLKFFLWLLSLIYYLGVGIILFAYKIGIFKKYSLGLPVISVGNITWGGTGKTPFVIYLSQALRKMGKRPAILTRGYSLGENRELFSDEAELFKDCLGDIPVIVGKNRLKSAKDLKKDSVDCLILDDGFQQWKMKKYLEIVMVNTQNPFGNRRLLPRGILREPLSSLKRANVFILNKINDNTTNISQIKMELSKLNRDALSVESKYELEGFFNPGNKKIQFDDLRNKKVILVSAIADPLYFEQLIQTQGLSVVEHIKFRDHYKYETGDIKNIIDKALGSGVDIVVTTDKDMIKLKFFIDNFNKHNVNLLTLRINFKIFGNEQALLEKINAIFTH